MKKKILKVNFVYIIQQLLQKLTTKHTQIQNIPPFETKLLSQENFNRKFVFAGLLPSKRAEGPPQACAGRPGAGHRGQDPGHGAAGALQEAAGAREEVQAAAGGRHQEQQEPAPGRKR